MKNEVLIVLGAPNSSKGILSDISKSRLDYCKSIFKEGDLVLCTGGWGEQFNKSSKAHALYAQNYLISKGLNKKDFLDIALSNNTVDDAVKIKPIISKLKKVNVTIITSDYHLKRVQLIFNEILNHYKMKFIGVTSNLESKKLNTLIEHESKAIKSIKKNGLYY
jgi:uncharacterized SAM-binding protein YcdF (DUF218 family)